MKISPIILALRERCPTLEGRIGGTADLPTAEEATNLALPCAFVLAPRDSANDASSPNFYRQQVDVEFDVMLYVSSETDERGLDACDLVEDLKHEVIRALIGSEPDDCGDWITFGSAGVEALNRAYLVYRLTFNCAYMIVDEETYHGDMLKALPPFEGLHLETFGTEGNPKGKTPIAVVDLTFNKEEG